jgi:tyrosine-protein phosphatase SIW14
MRRLSPLLLLGLAALGGCATGPRGYPPHDGIANFDRVHDHLYRGGQPTDLGVKTLGRLGIRTVINLRMGDDVWPAEEAEVQAAGMVYTNIPMSGCRRPSAAQVAKVLRLIETSPAPVFVHCKHGCDRTGTIVACYRVQHDQWTSREALREARQYGMSRWMIGMKHCVKDFARSHRAN